MSTGAQVDPHDKMRARDVSKVARGQQATAPPHEYGTVSPPPPPSSTKADQHRNKVYIAFLFIYIIICLLIGDDLIYIDGGGVNNRS